MPERRQPDTPPLSRTAVQFVAQPDLTFAHWQDESSAVVFNLRSGDTHLVNLAALHVLQAAKGTALSVPQAAESVAQAFELESDGQLETDIKQLLLQLSQQGLMIRFVP